MRGPGIFCLHPDITCHIWNKKGNFHTFVTNFTDDVTGFFDLLLNMCSNRVSASQIKMDWKRYDNRYIEQSNSRVDSGPKDGD